MEEEMTVKELETLLRSAEPGQDYEEYAGGHIYGEIYEVDKGNTFKVKDLELNVVDTGLEATGYEGRVLFVVFGLGDRLFRATAPYDSWEGSYWSEGDLEEVESYEETVVKYRKVK